MVLFGRPDSQFVGRFLGMPYRQLVGPLVGQTVSWCRCAGGTNTSAHDNRAGSAETGALVKAFQRGSLRSLALKDAAFFWTHMEPMFAGHTCVQQWRDRTIDCASVFLLSRYTNF